MKALTYIEHGKFALMDKRSPRSLTPADIEEAYRVFENKLDGVIKVAVIPQ